MEDEKKEPKYDIDDQLDPSYLEVRDTGMLDGLLQHLEKEHPSVKAYVEMVSSRYAHSLTLQLDAIFTALDDEETRKEFMKKFDLGGNK